MMKTLFAVVFIAIAAVFLFKNNLVETTKAMPIKPDITQQPASTGSTYYLSADAIEDLSIKGKAGDGDAAFRLHRYYRFTARDKSNNRLWLEVAANAGNSVAQYNLAFELLDDKNLSEARKWALAAQKNGDESAKNLLAEIEKQEKRN